MIKLIKRNNLAKSIIVALVLFSTIILIPFILRNINNVVTKATEINSYSSLFGELMGFGKRKRVLILFMNNAEMRFGGGFIGSVAYITVDKGNISAEPVRSVYYYDRKNDQIEYFESFAKPRFEDKGKFNIRNSGRNLEWTKNGKRAEEIFEKESGKEVDYVVAVTPEVLKYFLEQTGPVYLEDYKKTIDKNNIIEELQTEVEYGEDKKIGNDPKTILTSTTNKILAVIAKKNLKDLSYMLRGFKKLADSKQIILYSSKKALQEKIYDNKLAGNIEKFDGDYLQVAEENVSIDKSSAFIKRESYRKINIKENGEIEISLSINRNQYKNKSFEYIDPHNGEFTYLIKENSSDINIAIPKGSRLVGNECCMKINYKNNEENVDVYEFRSNLIPLENTKYEFRYVLPYTLSLEQKYFVFNSFVQLQNGGWPYDLKTEIIAPRGWKFVASNHKSIFKINEGIVYDSIIDKDELTSVIYEKQ